MKVWIWKEIRQNWTWALLTALVLGGALAYSLMGHTSESLCDRGFLTVTTFGFAFTGAGLACLQLLPELRRDDWAFLIHRPVSPWRILCAKIAAGFLLYGLATLPPLACVSLWASRPGFAAMPFYWELTLAPLADLLMGIPFYFATMLMILKPGRWYGTRLLSLGLAVLVATWVHLAPDFSLALVLIVFASAMLLAVLKGVFFASRGSRELNSVSKAAWIVLVFVTLWFGGTQAMESVFRKLQTWNSSDDEDFTPQFVLENGKLAQALPKKGRMEIRDLDGAWIRTTKPLERLKGLHDTLKSLWESSPSREWCTYREIYRYCEWLPPGDLNANFSAYYDYAQRRVLFFDHDTKRLVGAMGPKGFVKDPAGCSTFPEDKRRFFRP